MMHFDDISDDEIRIISDSGTPARLSRKAFYRQWWFWTVIVVVLMLLALSFLLAHHSSTRRFTDATKEFADTTIKTEEVTFGDEAVPPTVMECEPATVLDSDIVVNDVPLRLRMPVNAMPELVIGIPDTTNESLILALQAADIRADNNGIVGAFVLKGEMLSRGGAKRGFCAIIDGKIHLGMAESTPLFEEATDKEGYFFRQYPLVNYGQMVENKPKGKALRHALCELDGRIVVVSSLDRESFHDFAQALADLGVQNALALTGGNSYGFIRDGGFESWGDRRLWENTSNVNFIVWRVSE